MVLIFLLFCFENKSKNVPRKSAYRSSAWWMRCVVCYCTTLIQCQNNNRRKEKIRTITRPYQQQQQHRFVIWALIHRSTHTHEHCIVSIDPELCLQKKQPYTIHRVFSSRAFWIGLNRFFFVFFFVLLCDLFILVCIFAGVILHSNGSVNSC